MGTSQSLLQDSLLLSKDGQQQQILSEQKTSKKLDIDDGDEEIRNDYPDLEPYENENHEQHHNVKFVKNNGIRKLPKPSPLETSIITLYVSGRKPGEFSTVLSTVIHTVDAANTLLQKRAIDNDIVVKSSNLPDFYDVYNAEGSDIDETFIPAEAKTNELNYIEASHNNGVENRAIGETQSLESILGDVSNYVNTHTKSFLF